MPNFSCLEVVDLWLETKKKAKKQVSIKLIFSLAQAQAEVVAKFDQYWRGNANQ